MPEEVSLRLGQVEAAAHRAAELISRLKAEKTQLVGERADREERLAAQARELEEQRAELARLRQERREILAQVDGILKELDSLELD